MLDKLQILTTLFLHQNVDFFPPKGFFGPKNRFKNNFLGQQVHQGLEVMYEIGNKDISKSTRTAVYAQVNIFYVYLDIHIKSRKQNFSPLIDRNTLNVNRETIYLKICLRSKYF